MDATFATTVDEALKRSAIARGEAEILLAHVLSHDRAWVLAHADAPITAKAADHFHRYVERRRAHEPIAYILGKKEFYGRDFTVNASVLVPRPCTEELIRMTLAILHGDHRDRMETIDEQIIAIAKFFQDPSDVKTIIDIGTGTGCIGISLVLEDPSLRVIVTDISDDALVVARTNAKQHNVLNRLTFLQGDALEPVYDLQEPFLIVSNPPYIPEGEELPSDVILHEPRSALFAGKKGTDVVQRIWLQAQGHRFCRGVVLECRAEQAPRFVEEQ